MAQLKPLQQGNHSQKWPKVTDFRKIMQEVRNDERIEEREKERSKNVIIHGLDEKGDNDARKEHDAKMIDNFLETVGVASKPVSITRLGKLNQENNKKRTVKVVVSTSIDTDYVMRNLKRLKNTENKFGKIRVTNDDTSGEREQIKNWVKKAEEKSSGDSNFIYRVRGDPKNGLRLVAFTRQIPISA